MKLKEIIDIIENFAPPELQESYDNAGLTVGDKNGMIRGILICLDVTESVLEEAIKNNCNLIVSHHPLIFKGIKSITGRNEVERILVQAIKSDIAIYAAHTNLDNVIDGVNGKIACKLELQDSKILKPQAALMRKLVTFCPTVHAGKIRGALFRAGAGHIGNYDSCSFNLQGSGSFRGLEGSEPFVGKVGTVHFEEEVRIETIYPSFKEPKILKALFETHPYEEVAYDIYPLGNEYSKVGSGIIGSMKEEIDEVEFLQKIKTIFGISCIRHSGLTGKKVKKVAICGGSGAFLIGDALKSGANVFLTGDIKYHDFFLTDEKILLADVGHYESEQFTKELLHSILIKKIPNFAIFISEVRTNPIHYF